MRFYKDRDSTKNEILQNEEGTLKKARPRFFTIGALRPMGGIWASNNKSRASVTLIIKFRDSPERGGHFEESPTEILHHRGPPPHGGPLGQQQQVQGPLHPHHQVHRG